MSSIHPRALLLQLFRCDEEDITKLHTEEMMKAAEDAKQEYLKDHPDVDIDNLKYDPVKLLDKCKHSALIWYFS